MASLVVDIDILTVVCRCGFSMASQDAFLGHVETDITALDFGADFDDNYGLIQPEQTALVRVFSDDTDEQMLNEIQPRYIIMFEPNLEFVRRVEVRASVATARSTIHDLIIALLGALGLQEVEPRTWSAHLSLGIQL